MVPYHLETHTFTLACRDYVLISLLDSSPISWTFWSKYSRFRVYIGPISVAENNERANTRSQSQEVALGLMDAKKTTWVLIIDLPNKIIKSGFLKATF